MPKRKEHGTDYLCPHCSQPIDEETIKLFVGRYSSSKRKTHSGPPKAEVRCEFCGEKFGGREIRIHIPRCYSNPGATKLKCTFCGREEFRKSELAYHMGSCSKNPLNKSRR